VLRRLCLQRGKRLLLFRDLALQLRDLQDPSASDRIGSALAACIDRAVEYAAGRTHCCAKALLAWSYAFK
jgi:hypothetical protein